MSVIESFNNPYTKLIIVCKVCNKESSKFQANWRTHFLSVHVSNDEKPHKCKICSKGFIKPYLLAKHMKVHEDSKTAVPTKKEEPIVFKADPYFTDEWM